METNNALQRAFYLLRNGFLSIDEEGRVWRNAISIRGRWKQITPRRAENPAGNGYLRITLSIPDKGLQCIMAHRVVWEWFSGPIPPGLQVNHKDSNKHNNRLDNLEIVDQSGNIRHSYATGNRPRPWSKATLWRGKPRVSHEQEEEILRLRKSGLFYREIATATGISITHVQRIATQKGG